MVARDRDEKDRALHHARSMIIDLINGYPVGELVCSPAELVYEITELLNDGDDPDVREELHRVQRHA